MDKENILELANFRGFIYFLKILILLQIKSSEDAVHQRIIPINEWIII